MKRILLTALLSTILLGAIEAASPWTPIAEKLEKSVVFIEIMTGNEMAGSCTGFVINAEKKLVLTAAHCAGEKVLVDGTPTYKVFHDERHDLMVLRANNIDRPAVVVAKKNPERGDQVASLGYGFGLVDPVFRVTHVSNVNLQIESLASLFVMVDSGFLPGQSGGPVVNVQGEVVAIVQRGSDSLGLGVGAEVIRSRVGRYLPE